MEPVLRDPQEVAEELLYDFAEEDTRNWFRGACRRGTQKVYTQLRGDLRRATIVEEFFVRRDLDFGLSPVSNGVGTRRATTGALIGSNASQASLWLRQGFVDLAEPLVVYGAQRRDALDKEDERFNLNNVAGDEVFISMDADKGILRVFDFGLANSYIRVEYTAGFTNDGGDPPVIDNSDPRLDVHRELMTLEVEMAANTNPIIRREALDNDTVRELKTQKTDLILNSARYEPNSARPYTSTPTLV